MVQGKTMAALAAALQAEGIEVCQHYEDEGSMYAPLSAVVHR